MSLCLQQLTGFVQVEVSLGQYLSHVSLAARDSAESASASGSELDFEQLVTQLSELDKMGQEGAKPVDDAEVGTCTHTSTCASCLICKSRAASLVHLIQVRKIDRKLKACHNPLLDPESDVYKKHAAAAEQQEQEARDQKVATLSHTL